MSDLGASDVPLYGYQNNTYTNPVGTGDVYSPGGGFSSTYLQTATYIPEPCSSVMMLMLGAMALLGRRRSWIG